MNQTARIAVGVSGAGSNLRALAAAGQRGILGGSIVIVSGSAGSGFGIAGTK